MNSPYPVNKSHVPVMKSGHRRHNSGINFAIGLDKNALIDEITAKSYVILWYIGPKGPTSEGIPYYRKLIQNLRRSDKHFNILLYNMENWKAFNDSGIRDSNEILLDTPKEVELVNNMNIDRINMINSGDFFKWLTTEHDQEVQEKMHEVLQREFLLDISSKYNKVGINICDVIKTKLPKCYEDLDAVQAYAPIQYLEACYLLAHTSHPEQDFTFVLPNNEYRYYDDYNSNLLEDTKVLFPDKEIPEHVHVICFKFTENVHSRPYIRGKPLNRDLTHKDF